MIYIKQFTCIQTILQSQQSFLLVNKVLAPAHERVHGLLDAVGEGAQGRAHDEQGEASHGLADTKLL